MGEPVRGHGSCVPDLAPHWLFRVGAGLHFPCVEWFPIFTYKGVPIILSADFSKETLQARKDWQEVFEVMKNKNLQPRLLYPAKLSFRMEGQIMCFPDKVKLKEFFTIKPLLYGMLKGLT